MTEGPYLYDDGPAALHTGTGRNRNGTLVALISATALVAVLMVVGMLWFKGSAADQAEEVAGVFTKALAAGDTETAYALVCDSERARITANELAGDYVHPGTPVVTGSRGERIDDSPVRYVTVRWEDGDSAITTEITVVPDGGTSICGTTTGD